MKSIELLIDEDGYVCNTEDGTEKYSDDFKPCGKVCNRDGEGVFEFFMDDSTIGDENFGPYPVYILVHSSDFDKMLSNDGEYFMGHHVEFY